MARRRIRLEVSQLLGFGGLIPFLACAMGMWMLKRPWNIGAYGVLGFYSASIIAFLGGARWGVEAGRPGAPRGGVLAASVIAPLFACALLFAGLKPVWTLIAMILAFAVQGAWDLVSASLPPWYRGLRLPLTIGAEAALAIALAWQLHPH